jgi:menaquinone-specific isochorismate synthase
MTNQSSALPHYEPHTNLSINKKSASECRNLSDIRYEIDTIDHFIVKLLQDRLQYALATLKFKLDGKPIPDNKRMIQQLNQRKEWAKTYALDPKYIESFFKGMIDWYISQQITYYKSQNPDQANIEIKICSLNELKAIEFGLTWINISQYSQLLSSGYRKARETTKPVLVSFTQKTSIYSDDHVLVNVHPLYLFEQSRRLSLSHSFVFTQPSQQFSMLALGSVQQYDVNQTHSSFNKIDKKIVADGWKRLLLDAIIENCAQEDFSGCGPTLTGGLCFEHQNRCRSGKWSNFDEASFILPRVQFTKKGLNRYATFNIVITKCDKSENEIEFINAEIISLLEFCSGLLNGTKEYLESGVHTRSFDSDNATELTQESLASLAIWKQTICDFDKVVLAREAMIETDQKRTHCNVGGSLKRLSILHPSSYLFGILRQGNCFFGATPEQLVRLHDNQIECTVLTGITYRCTNEIEAKISKTELLNCNKQRHEHSLVVEMLRSKLEPIIEANSLVIPDKPVVLEYGNKQRLYTLVRGTIRKEITPFDLVEALHSTPTVGGFPQSDALKFIPEEGNFDCGWYVAPIGWIDANNNSEFIVASGSALINEGSISLFTGCGIVADSDPEDRLHKTRSIQ